MKWHENRALAWVALALCVAVSLFGLGGLSLRRARGQALDVFVAGTDPAQPVRHSMDAYLAAAAESARIMAAEAELLGADAALCEGVVGASAVVGDAAADPSDRWSAYVSLKDDADRLYNAAHTDDKAAFAAFKLAYDDFWGDDDLIRHDGYPAIARSYNRLIAGFPARLVALATGCGALETFGG